MAKLQITVESLTDIGKVRSSNQDSSAGIVFSKSSPLPGLAVLAVADGMGGHAGGEVASKVAIETFFSKIKKSFEMHYAEGIKYYQLTSDVKTQITGVIRDAMVESNDAVYRKSLENFKLKGMGTTLTAAVVLNGVAVFANVGDSRGYLISNGELNQVTRDHSWVAEQVLTGLITEEESRSHPNRNIITRSIGTAPSVEIDLEEKNIQKGDIVFLCSDGLYPVLSENEILNEFKYKKNETVCRKLIDKANDNGGPDNIAVAIARVESDIESADKFNNGDAPTETANQYAFLNKKVKNWIRELFRR
ncbi:MAG: hypothetical protein CL785_02005 [Chloroflexi bacterium]|nr:hypothetical protein [Chloroflexota bacterium]|tara:strand:+ start:1534 stop:2448 length:915 start_codon:yes stop_codon:yes gene_type:complete